LLLDSWSESKNLGTPVNSDYDERTPFMMTDGTTFYFASDRPGGMGGMDIYQSIYDAESNSFSEPENMGPPFNSPADDYLFAADPFTEKAWFTTNRGVEPGKVVVATIKWDNSVIKNLTDSLEQITIASQLPVKEDTTQTEESETSETSDYRNQQATDKPDQFTFHVSDTTVYNHYEDFLSEAALSEFKRGRRAESKTDSLKQLMRHKRQEYSRSYNQEKLNNLIDEILELEKTVYGHNDQAKRHYARARQMESEKIAQLAEEGEYQNLKRKEKTTTDSKSSFSNLPDPEEFTFYTDEEFNERREKLSGMYQKFFKPHQIQTLHRTDSMYTWANIMNLEASRILEETAEEGSIDEKSILKRFKNIDSLLDSDNQPRDNRKLQKEASGIREKALNLYHEALDTKYSIYLPVLHKLANLSENESAKNTINKAQSYFEEADQGIKKIQTWNPEQYERMGSIKREAINLMEEELLNLPTSQANSLEEASEEPTENDESPMQESFDNPPENKTGKQKKEEKPDTLVKSALGSSDQTQKQETEQQETENQAQKPVYKIQIGVFQNQPDENALSSIPEVSSEEVENAQTTRYFSGKWDTYNEAKKHVEEVMEKGFPGAFVVAFLNGEQIPLNKAREMSNKE
ncbi:MAG: tetratricopeptide repeat protein, partial [Bacteroidota bacterium]